MSSEEPSPGESFGKLMQQYQRAIDAEDFDDATRAVHDIFALAQDWCYQSPSPDLDLTIAAEVCEENADWRGAESTYRRILSLPNLGPAAEFKAHSSLASLCRLLNRDSDALSHVRRATAAARTADLSLLLSMALQREAQYLIRAGHIGEACNVIAEALSVIDVGKMYNHTRASILTLRAECAIRNSAFADATRDLDQAFAFLEPLAKMEIAAGVHGVLAQWWSVTARLRAERGDRDMAIAAWQKAVSISQHVASLPHAENVHTKVTVADMLKGLADALLVCDRADDAATAFDERKEILDSVRILERNAE